MIVDQCSGDKFRGVDILLTSEWPKGVDNFTKPPVCTVALHSVIVHDIVHVHTAMYYRYCGP